MEINPIYSINKATTLVSSSVNSQTTTASAASLLATGGRVDTFLIKNKNISSPNLRL